MKKTLLLALLFSTSVAFATKVTISSPNGTLVYNPVSVSVVQGDTIVFSLGSSHNAVEVSETNYNANNPTGLQGGFSVGFGGGEVPTAALSLGTHYYVCTPHVSLGMKATITITAAPTTRKSASMASLLKTFPNPATSAFSVQVPENGTLAMYDMTGRKVMEQQVTTGLQLINTSAFRSGTYLVELIAEDAVLTRRVIISQ